MSGGKTQANALIVQAGGPTAVFNASLAAILSAARKGRCFQRIYGSRLGFRGLLEYDWADLTGVEDLEKLRLQPGAALGSGRKLLLDAGIPEILQTFKEQNIIAAFIIGGNGSMVAANKLHVAVSSAGADISVIGVPKTIDNDIDGVDVCPGYASAAQFVIQTARDVALDLHSMRDFDDVTVFEVMGRDTGWLAAAAALSRWSDESAPHIVLVPELPIDEEALLNEIQVQHQRQGYCMVVAAEGIRGSDGILYAEKLAPTSKDDSGQKLVALSGGSARYLAQLVNERLKLRCRQIRPDTIQRSASRFATELDRTLAALCGEQAVNAYLNNDAGTMATLHYDGATWESASVPLSDVVSAKTRTLPAEFISPRGELTPAFAKYLESLELKPADPPLLY